ncbi:hypothetical protein EJD97_013774 [Solanum chilense]|uniref:Integrase zinc-binding domain-containing protein n=1 Tax=Solanum chilense TaxID=4083 RepID=A0A6N2BAG3_SOLCI|nr:hypothetical protein EJD97_013774 [Solanum chilense]
MSVLNHPVKENVVADTLSRMTMGSVSHVVEAKKELAKTVHRLAILVVMLEDSHNGGIGYCKHNESFSLGGDGALRYQRRLCVPNVDGLTNRNLEEAHWSCYSIHLGSSIMYHNLREVFWWEGFWRSFQEGFSTMVKLSTTFHSQTNGQEECTIQTLEDILIDCIIDFKGNWYEHFPWCSLLTTIATIHRYLWLLTKSCMVGDVDLQLDGLKWVHRISNHLQKSCSREKSYAVHRRIELEFEDGDKVCLKILPMKRVVRLGNKGHPESILPVEGLGAKYNLSYGEVPV